MKRKPVKVVVAEHHHKVLWIAVGLLAVSAILFTLEILAPAGVIGVLGVVLQGLLDDN